MHLDLELSRSALAATIAALAGRELTVATAESLTGGLLGAVLTEIPGSSAVFRGGLLVYATELKTVLAGVDPALLAAHGPVHPDVAVQLADGARTRCGATLGVGLTGVAGPDPQDGLPAGTFHVAVSDANRTLTLAGDPSAVPADRDAVRSWVRSAAVLAAIRLLDHVAHGRWEIDPREQPAAE